MNYFGFNIFLVFLCLLYIKAEQDGQEVKSNFIGNNSLSSNQTTKIESIKQDCVILDDGTFNEELLVKPDNVKSILINNTIPYCPSSKYPNSFKNITMAQQLTLDLIGAGHYIRAGSPTRLSHEYIYEFTDYLQSYSHLRTQHIYDVLNNLDHIVPGGKQNIHNFFEYLGKQLTNFDDIPIEVLSIAFENHLKFNMSHAIIVYSELQKQQLLTHQLVLAIDQAKAKYPPVK